MKTIKPFICLNDFEGFKAFSEGYHSHGGEPINVGSIYIGYPFASWYETLEDKNFMLENVTDTLEELMLAINDIIVKADKAGELGAPHCVEDFCIEILKIYENGSCTVEFGS